MHFPWTRRSHIPTKCTHTQPLHAYTRRAVLTGDGTLRLLCLLLCVAIAWCLRTDCWNQIGNVESLTNLFSASNFLYFSLRVVALCLLLILCFLPFFLGASFSSSYGTNFNCVSAEMDGKRYPGASSWSFYPSSLVLSLKARKVTAYHSRWNSVLVVTLLDIELLLTFFVLEANSLNTTTDHKLEREM